MWFFCLPNNYFGPFQRIIFIATILILINTGTLPILQFQPTYQEYLHSLISSIIYWVKTSSNTMTTVTRSRERTTPKTICELYETVLYQ